MLKAQSFINPIQHNINYSITSDLLLWRAVIVRAVLDALNLDIHAWGYARKVIVDDANKWFDKNNEDFNLVCDYSNLQPYFVIKLFNRIKEKNDKKLFNNKNLNKFLLEYLCTFTEEQ